MISVVLIYFGQSFSEASKKLGSEFASSHIGDIALIAIPEGLGLVIAALIPYFMLRGLYIGITGGTKSARTEASGTDIDGR